MKKIIHLLLLLCAFAASRETQAQIKVSELPAASSVSGADTALVVQSGTTKKATVTQILSAASATYQPLDSDLTAIAALTTTSNGRSLLTSTTLTATGLSLTNGANIDLWGAKTLPSGTVVGTTDTQTLTNKTFSTGSIEAGVTFGNPSSSRTNLGITSIATVAAATSKIAGWNNGATALALNLDSAMSIDSASISIATSSTSAAGKIQLATPAEVQTGTDSAKAVVSSTLTAWFTAIKAAAQTIAGHWNFTGTATINLANVATINVTSGTISGLTVTTAATLPGFTASGNGTINGNTTLGDSPGDAVTVNAANPTAPNNTTAGIGSTTLLNSSQVSWKQLQMNTVTQSFNVNRYQASRGGTGANQIIGSGAGTVEAPYSWGQFSTFNNDFSMDATTYSLNIFGKASNSSPSGSLKCVFSQPFSLPLRVAMRVDTAVPVTMYYGVCDTVTSGVPAARGFGVLMDATGLKMWQHDGTSLTVSGSYITSGVTAPNNADVWRNLILSNAGTGTMTLYYAEGNNLPSATALATLTIPTSSTTFTGNAFMSLRFSGTFASGALSTSLGIFGFAPFAAQ